MRTAHFPKRGSIRRGLLRTENAGAVSRTMQIDRCSPAATLEAAAIFDRFHGCGVLLNDAFTDDVWLADNETGRYRFDFRVAPEAFDKGGHTWMELSLAECVTALKTYIALQLGTAALAGLREALHDIRAVLAMDLDQVSALDPSSSVLSFIAFLPGQSPARDSVLESLDTKIIYEENSSRGQRTLADFKGYLRFDRLLDAWWSSASLKEKTDWFLIWLWWHLTMILPLRPTEFLVLPWDCVFIRDGSYRLSFRRTRLKKRRDSIGYRVETDYISDTTFIPDAMADTILWYRSAVSESKQVSGEAQEPSYLFGWDRPISYACARTLLQTFCTSVLPWDDSDGVPRPEIHLGDTRHLSMISLALSGCSPSVCKALAGHASTDISSHYFSNVSSLLESAVYEAVRCQGRSFEMQEHRFRLPPQEAVLHPVPGGACGYPPAAEGDISACLANYHPGQHCGDCSGCTYYYPDIASQYKVHARAKEQADQDGAFLLSMISQARKGLGMEETIEAAMERLHTSCRRYIGVLSREEALNRGKEAGSGKTKNL